MITINFKAEIINLIYDNSARLQPLYAVLYLYRVQNNQEVFFGTEVVNLRFIEKSVGSSCYITYKASYTNKNNFTVKIKEYGIHAALKGITPVPEKIDTDTPYNEQNIPETEIIHFVLTNPIEVQPQQTQEITTKITI